MEIGTELAEDLAAELLTRRGFVVDVEHLALFGLCADCSHAMRDADGYSRT
jgi:Fe2+ or Zn2+ uptake regulation protein